MTKADLVDQIITLGDLTRRDGEVIVDTLFDSIIGALKANDKVEVRGFGSFRTRQRKSRTGRNPKTGDSVAVPAKRVPFFKPSKDLRDLVNPSEAKPSTKAAKSSAKAGKTSANGAEPSGKGAADSAAAAKALPKVGSVDVHHPPPM